MASPDELKAQLKELMAIPENMVCLDCDDKRPMWASLVVPPPNAPFKNPLGCFCCYQCSGAHRRMGTHLCFVRSTNLDEWKEKEIAAMRDGGNKMINAMFEARLSDIQRTVLKPNNQTDLDTRSSFIFDKYQHRHWYDASASQGKIKRKENFVPPAPLDAAPPVAEPRISFEEDFFASRTGGGGEDFFDVRANKKGDTEDCLGGAFNSLGPEEIHYDPNSPMTPSTPSKKSPRMTAAGRTSLLGTLQRKESKRMVLDDIRHLEIDHDNPMPSPRRVSQSRNKSKKDGQKSSSRSGTREADDASSERSGWKKAPVRTKSMGSGSDEGGEKSSRRKPIKRNGSNGSEGRRRPIRRTGSDDSKGRRRPVKRTGSDENEGLKPKSERLTSSEKGRPSREPTTGMNRASSMSGAAKTKQSTRSQSVKRGVRRTTSSDGEGLHESLSSCASTTSAKSRGDEESKAESKTSRRSRPRRGARSPTRDDESQHSRRKDDESQTSRRKDDESQTSRRRRDAESQSTRRKRSPKSSGTDMRPRSRSPSPNGTEDASKASSGRRNRRSPAPDTPLRKKKESTISIRRMPTVRDRNKSPKNSDSKSPMPGQRTLNKNMESELLQVLSVDK